MPPQRRSKPITPAHWSKDFVEHLRTIHLTLIATAAAVVVVALTTKPYSTEVAKNELHKILELKANWSANFFRRDTVQSVSDSKPVNPLFPRVLPKQLEDDVGLDNSPICYVPTQSGTLECEFPLDDSIVIEQSMRAGDFAHLMPPPPETLSDFKVWWHIFLDSDDYIIYFPKHIARTGNFYDSSNHLRNKVEIYPIYERSLRKPKLSRPIKPGKAKLAFDWSRGLVFVIGSAPDRFVATPPSDTFVASVTRYEYTRINSKYLAKHLGLASGDFQHVFYDLRQVADKNGYENLSKLEDILSKSETSETPVFEVFGIKFPADVATLGGSIALLGAQLYFFLYLRRFSGGLNPDDAGWEVPWIGMDSSLLARGTYLLTITLLPATSMVILSEEAASRFTRGYRELNSIHLLAPLHKWHWTVQVKTTALIVAIVLSAILGILSWRYRPQPGRGLSSEPSPADLTDIDSNEI